MLIAWIGFAAIYVLYILNILDQKSYFGMFEFLWSGVSCLLFLVASIVLISVYVQDCGNQSGLVSQAAGTPACRQLLGATSVGFVVMVLFVVDMVFKREHCPKIRCC